MFKYFLHWRRLTLRAQIIELKKTESLSKNLTKFLESLEMKFDSINCQNPSQLQRVKLKSLIIKKHKQSLIHSFSKLHSKVLFESSLKISKEKWRLEGTKEVLQNLQKNSWIEINEKIERNILNGFYRIQKIDWLKILKRKRPIFQKWKIFASSKTKTMFYLLRIIKRKEIKMLKV